MKSCTTAYLFIPGYLHSRGKSAWHQWGFYVNWWQASKHVGAPLIPAGSAPEHPQLIPRLNSKDEVTKCFYSSESHRRGVWWGGGGAQRCRRHHSLSGWPPPPSAEPRQRFSHVLNQSPRTVQPVSAAALGEQMERSERRSAESGGGGRQSAAALVDATDVKIQLVRSAA